MKKFSLFDPWISSSEIKEVNKMMRNGWDNYNYVEKFEKTFAKWHGKKFALMTSCCTHAIHLALKSINLKNTDEVIVPDSTWISSAFPIAYENASPIFVDVSLSNWCIDEKKILSAITRNTKAIIFVDLFGNMPNIEKLIEISKKYNLYLIEDAAEALGTIYNKKKAGTFGDISVFSFHRSKAITTGEGGMILTDNKFLYEKCKHHRDLGRLKNKTYYSTSISPKYMPSNLAGCLGLSQFKRINELLKKKREIFSTYKKNLEKLEAFQFNVNNENTKNSCWATTIIINKNINLTANSLRRKLLYYNIPTRPFFYPLSKMKAFKNYGLKLNFSNPTSVYLEKKGLTLPSGYSLKKKQIIFICKKIKDILSNYILA